MKSNLPVILGVGKFKSEEQFKNKTSTPERNVTCYELELFTKSSGCCFINSEKHSIKKGSILLSRPGDTRCTKLHTECYFVHFMSNDESLNSLLKEMPKFIDESIYEDFEYLFINIKKAVFSENRYSKILAAAELLKLICKVSEQRSVKTLSSNNDSPVLQAIRYMSLHYKEDIKIDDIAANCNLSASHFYKLFLEYENITPNQYLTNLRISKAKELLLTTTKSLLQIAEESGFTSQAYFCYSFKKNTGTTPSAFRLETVIKNPEPLLQQKSNKPKKKNNTISKQPKPEANEAITQITNPMPSYLL